MEASGWAVTDGKEILVPTVSSTRRAAVVNYLVAKQNHMVYANDSDEAIFGWFEACRSHHPE